MAERTLRVNIIGDERDLLRAFGNSTRATRQFEAQMSGVSRSVRNVFAAAGVALGATAIVQAFRSTISAAIDFESSFAGVRKTVDATEPQLQALARGFRELSREIPVSVEELNRIGESAGQLGVQRGAILDFTKTIAAVGVTTNLAADQAADAFARLANITQTPQDQFDNLGATVVDLGNKLAATESEITDFGLRIAAAGKIVGLTVDETLAIAGAFTSVGVEAEAGGTAVSKVFISLANAVQTGGKQLEEFANTAGTSVGEFRRLFEENTAGAFVKFVEGLKRVDAEGGNVFQTLKNLGLTDVRLTRAFLSISQSGDLLSRSLAIGSKAWEDNSALQEEAAKRYETTASKLQIFQNRVNDLQITLGNVLAPALLEIITPLGKWLESTENQERVQRALIQTTDDVRAVVTGLRDVLVPLAEATKAVADQMGGLAEAVKLLLTVMIASKVVNFGLALAGVGTSATVATTKVTALRLALLRLAGIGIIAVAVEIIINRDAIDDAIRGRIPEALGGKSDIKIPIEPELRVEVLRNMVSRWADAFGQNSVQVQNLVAEIRKLETALGRLPELPGQRAEGPTGPNFGQSTPGVAVVQETAEAMKELAVSGDAIIAKITRQVAAQEDLNRQLRDSETRAAHLRDLIRADPTNGELQKRLTAELTKQQALQEQIATESKRTAEAAEQAAQAAQAQVTAMFDLRAAQADLTKSLQDNLNVAKEREQSLRRLSALNREDLDIALQLVNATAARRNLEQQINQAREARVLSQQFQAIGLTAEGDKPTPSAGALLERGRNLQNEFAVAGLGGSKMASQLRQVVNFLIKNLDSAKKDVRAAILAMFNTWASALKEGDQKTGGEITRGGIRSTQRLLRGLNLTEEERRLLTQRNLGVSGPRGQSAFGFALGTSTSTGTFRPERESGGNIIVQNLVVVSNDPNDMMKKLQKKARRSSGGRRGRHGGANLGMQ